MIPEKTVQEILDRTRIEEVVGDFVTLKRRGANFVACCPFHDEKTPSFSVSAAKGIFKCFGCGKAGNAVHFVMEHEHCGYADALRYLAKKYHVEIVEKEMTPEEKAAQQKTEALYLTMDFAQKHFVDNLKTQEGSALAMAYYHSRGLSDATIEKFGLGWSMIGYSALSEAAAKEGIKDEYLEDCGLAYRRDNGRMTDSFVERVTFPVYSVSGRIIAFSCRTLKKDDERSKYKNSKETDIYVKSKNLFGIFQAKSAIAKEDRAILVEGNIDVIQMHQSGVENVVASLGTSLTIEQIKVLHKFTDNITLMYDGDKAGVKAAMRAIGLILPEGIDLTLVLLPDGQDPDDFAKSRTREEILDYIKENQMDFVRYMFNKYAAEGALTDMNAMASAINSISDTIALIPDGIKRSVFIKELAGLFKVDEKLVASRVTATGRQNAQRTANPDPAAAQTGQPVVPQPEAPRIVVGKDPSAAVDKCERELVEYLLMYGCQPLRFPSGSPDYSAEERTVADFIDESLAKVSVELSNPVYKKMYNMYFDMYEAGLNEEQIQAKLTGSTDQDVVAVATDILMVDLSPLTSQNLIASMPSLNQRLTSTLPIALKRYQIEIYNKLIRELTDRYERNPDNLDDLRKIDIYNKKRAKISNELNRI